MPGQETEKDEVGTSDLPAQNTIAAVGVLGAIAFAALAVVARTPAYVLDPQTYEAAYYWPFSAHGQYLTFLVADLAISGAICLAACIGGVLARSRRRVYGGARPSALADTLVGISFAAFASATYFVTAPLSTAVGLGAAVASAVIAWLSLREDWEARR